MKSSAFLAAAVAFLSSQAFAHSVQLPQTAQATLVLTCTQVGGDAFLDVISSDRGLSAVLSGGLSISGISQLNADGSVVYLFNQGDASAEVRRVNGRYVGVLIEQSKEMILSCAELVN